MRGCQVRAVMAWYVYTAAYAEIGGFGPDVDPRVLEDATRQALDAIVESIGDTADVQIERVLTMGKPAQVLLDEAREADLLVVGSRGRGGFAGLLLGSVSHQCALHAPCPIAIVHSPAKQAAGLGRPGPA